MSQGVDITIVVPVYNSVDTLLPLFERLQACMKKQDLAFEVLYVEDGGTDESWKELKRIKSLYPDDVSLIRFGRNYGQNAATVCGISHAKGDIVVTIDDDLQTPPEEIEKLLAEFKETDAAVVFGITAQQNNPLIKRVGSTMIKKIFDWVDGSDIGSSFRLISPRLKEKLNTNAHDKLFLNQVIHWYTDELAKVEVEHDSRTNGKSGYSVFGLIAMALRLIFFYTDFPLRLMTITGLLIAVVCFGLGIYYIYEKIVIGAEAGFASIITAIFFATGVIMVCMSVLGAYISRIYADRIKKPVYSIKSMV
ncbi:MAG: glycosyltransferase family 2 protein [Flavobacteriales bacterium]|nr:glycosyltransferase family 2 protein [Flavobacteriales bacterium]